MSQTADILSYIQKNGSITPLEALQQLGCFRLGARVWDLRASGVPVEKEMVEENGKRFARYFMKKPLGTTNTERREGRSEVSQNNNTHS